MEQVRIKSGALQFGETAKSIRGKPLKGTEEIIGLYTIEKWELPCLSLISKTNCFEPTGKQYTKWGATIPTRGGSQTIYFPTLAEAEIFALTHNNIQLEPSQQ